MSVGPKEVEEISKELSRQDTECRGQKQGTRPEQEDKDSAMQKKRKTFSWTQYYINGPMD